eukprot:TRINITY_DN57877_c0_g1_i1.p1 TRINITY_DN57877_c0_g1~~TRINITY_DN57877_c0_g1_i1.p1  ORF type:complete len:766 (+),score=96.20 TRINITY_DN57877_c0_g1_i1:248-2299(+)
MPDPAEDAAASDASDSQLPDDLSLLTPLQILSLPVLDVARAIRENHVKSADLLRASVAKIQEDTALYNNVTSISHQAVEEATILDEIFESTGKVVGPLHGVPFIVGDNIHVVGFPTTCGSRTLADYYPSKSSPVVEVLIAAGAIVVAKGNMDEFGLGFMGQNASTGTLLNPLDPQFYAGGSQGGCAMSVTLDCVPFAIATDVQGDLRIPASFCNVIAFLPSDNVYSRKNTWMLSRTTGGIGIVAKTVSDVHAVNQIMCLSTEEDTTQQQALCSLPFAPEFPVSAPKILVAEDHFTGALDHQIRRSFMVTLAMFEVQGVVTYHDYEEAKQGVRQMTKTSPATPDNMEEPIKEGALSKVGILWKSYQQVIEAEMCGIFEGICHKAGISHQDAIQSITTEYGKNLVQGNEFHTASAMERAIEDTESLRETLDDFWEGLPHDVQGLVLPTTLMPPTRVSPQNAQMGLTEFNTINVPVKLLASNTLPFSAIGCPSIVLPLGRRISPLLTAGITIVGRPGDDQRLLSLATTLDEMIKSGAAELQAQYETKIQNEYPVLQDAPEWLEDRTKNMWALTHDMTLGVLKTGGVRVDLIKELRMAGRSVPEGMKKSLINPNHPQTAEAIGKNFRESVGQSETNDMYNTYIAGPQDSKATDASSVRTHAEMNEKERAANEERRRALEVLHGFNKA